MDNPIFDHNTFKQKTSCKLSSPTMNVGINGPAEIVSPDHHQIWFGDWKIWTICGSESKFRHNLPTTKGATKIAILVLLFGLDILTWLCLCVYPICIHLIQTWLSCTVVFRAQWFHQRVVVRLQLQGILVCEPQSRGNLANSQVMLLQSPSKWTSSA